MQHYSDESNWHISQPDIIEHVHVGKNYSTDEYEAYKALFKEFYDIFSYSYEEMSGIDTSSAIVDNLIDVRGRKVVLGTSFI